LPISVQCLSNRFLNAFVVSAVTTCSGRPFQCGTTRSLAWSGIFTHVQRRSRQHRELRRLDDRWIELNLYRNEFSSWRKTASAGAVWRNNNGRLFHAREVSNGRSGLIVERARAEEEEQDFRVDRKLRYVGAHPLYRRFEPASVTPD